MATKTKRANVIPRPERKWGPFHGALESRCGSTKSAPTPGRGTYEA
jgi:hypothetical protein